MKQLIAYCLIFFICIMAGRAQEFGRVASGAGMIREDRNQNNTDSSAFKRRIPDQSISIFPNPATDYVWVVISSDYPTLYRATIFDINGTVLFHKDWLTEAGACKYYLTLPTGSQNLPLFIRINGPLNAGACIFRILKQI